MFLYELLLFLFFLLEKDLILFSDKGCYFFDEDSICCKYFRFLNVSFIVGVKNKLKFIEYFKDLRVKNLCIYRYM